MNRDYLTAQSVTSFGQEEITTEPQLVFVQTLSRYLAGRRERILFCFSEVRPKELPDQTQGRSEGHKLNHSNPR
jgi:hypothetical protein